MKIDVTKSLGHEIIECDKFEVSHGSLLIWDANKSGQKLGFHLRRALARGTWGDVKVVDE